MYDASQRHEEFITRIFCCRNVKLEDNIPLCTLLNVYFDITGALKNTFVIASHLVDIHQCVDEIVLQTLHIYVKKKVCVEPVKQLEIYHIGGTGISLQVS